MFSAFIVVLEQGVVGESLLPDFQQFRLITPPTPPGGKGAADFCPGGHPAAEGDGRRGVPERGGGGERHLQPVQQPAGNKVNCVTFAV